jgi:hypothetical protein
MDSTSEKVSSIFDSLKTNNFDADIKSAESFSSLTGEEGTGFFSNIPWYFWLIAVLVLSFLGINIFVYLAKGSDDINNFFGPIIKNVTSFFGIAAVNTTKQTISVVKTGANAIAEAEVTQGQSLQTTIPQNDLSQNTKVYNVLNSTKPQENKNKSSVPLNSEYSADDSYSPIQQSKSANKAGWCYIGEDRGFRSCINVTENDNCMSGNIFPSKDICINPSLRV